MRTSCDCYSMGIVAMYAAADGSTLWAWAMSTILFKTWKNFSDNENFHVSSDRHKKECELSRQTKQIDSNEAKERGLIPACLDMQACPAYTKRRHFTILPQTYTLSRREFYNDTHADADNVRIHVRKLGNSQLLRVRESVCLRIQRPGLGRETLAGASYAILTASRDFVNSLLCIQPGYRNFYCKENTPVPGQTAAFLNSQHQSSEPIRRPYKRHSVSYRRDPSQLTLATSRAVLLLILELCQLVLMAEGCLQSRLGIGAPFYGPLDPPAAAVWPHDLFHVSSACDLTLIAAVCRVLVRRASAIASGVGMACPDHNNSLPHLGLREWCFRTQYACVLVNWAPPWVFRSIPCLTYGYRQCSPFGGRCTIAEVESSVDGGVGKAVFPCWPQENFGEYRCSEGVSGGKPSNELPTGWELWRPMLGVVFEAWEEIKPSTLQIYWENLWPSIPQENQEQYENQPTANDDADFDQVFQRLEGCDDVEENDIYEWTNSDSDIGHQVLSEDEIVEACIANTAKENDSSEDDDTDEPIGLTHGEVTTMLGQLMTYFDKQSHTSSAELLALRNLLHRTAKLQSSLKQKNITDFFQRV
ncbi:hypothetical protein PR048_009293 [Dryococelus australis]|uniref:Uncharacterized protein n=1 Tax=Dryococelus australis TaxID=614101 RepID=A0ABQ9HZG3_9NEOP|nr:hypothetical protein PR048_009293 [Dryococelus australis]